jgi:hypothetical protein
MSQASRTPSKGVKNIPAPWSSASPGSSRCPLLRKSWHASRLGIFDRERLPSLQLSSGAEGIEQQWGVGLESSRRDRQPQNISSMRSDGMN